MSLSAINNSGGFIDVPLCVRINCFLARPKSKIVGEWVQAQHSLFPRVNYSWTEVGTDLLDPIVCEYKNRVKLLPFDLISPVGWSEVSKFSSKWTDSRKILKNSHIVMLSNKALQKESPELAHMSLKEISEGGNLIADVIKKALNPGYEPLGILRRFLNNLIEW